MDLSAFLIVLLAAFLHAVWNAAVKADGDRVLFMSVFLAASSVPALIAIPFVPAPDPRSWIYIALSVVLHQGYTAFLLMAYRYGDLSHVYPLARGSAPLIVALASVFLIGERLSGYAVLAIVLMAVGIVSLSLTRNAQHLRDPWAVVFALGTAAFIAAYTIVDGIGVRAAGNPHSYAAWMLGLEGLPMIAFVLLQRGPRAIRQMRRVWLPATVTGVLSLIAYWAVIWAMAHAPIALVAALRETSVVIAVWLGVVFLKERLSLSRLVATFTALAGMVLLKMGRS